MAFQIVGLVADTASMLRRLQEAVNALGSGRSNAIGSMTLTADARYHRFQVDVTGGFAHAQASR